MLASYIPAKLPDLVTWCDNFRDQIVADPVSYGLTAADAANIAAVVNDLDAKFALSWKTSPATRTPQSVADTHNAKLAALAICRPYAQLIQSMPGVTPASRAAAGITIRSTVRTPIPAPITHPVLGLVAMQPGIAMIGFADEATPASKAKPYGAIQIEVAASVATPTPAPELIPNPQLFTKSPIAYDVTTIPAVSKGQAVSFYARWVTRRGLRGPWSTALLTNIV